MIKKYVLLVISDKPLNLGKEKIKKIVNSNNTNHFVYEQLNLAQSNGSDWEISKNLSHHGHGTNPLLVESEGSTVSGVVIGLLKNLCSYFDYKPIYKRFEKQEKEEILKLAIEIDSSN